MEYIGSCCFFTLVEARVVVLVRVEILMLNRYPKNYDRSVRPYTWAMRLAPILLANAFDDDAYAVCDGSSGSRRHLERCF